MHGRPNEGLKMQLLLKKKKSDFFDKCFYYLINGESTDLGNCFIQGLKLTHQSFTEFVNYSSHSCLFFFPSFCPSSEAGRYAKKEDDKGKRERRRHVKTVEKRTEKGEKSSRNKKST